MPIVFQKPDGSVRIMNLSPRYLAACQGQNETVADAVARIAVSEQAKNPQDLADAVPTLIKTADLPVDRSKRHKWRLSGTQVVVDDAIPDQPHPKQALMDEIDGASTIAQLRNVLRKLL